ncbi:4a-hydroxytetrahydrobiopterin dehydratase [Bacillus sp. AFS076308]|uniref:4a-hydroxytetrahydrobiopterin dehydratase n=1 Tax=unclassified Bacillus (in: firmicutes) TaxID=185979 RepID=UPI000BF27A4F|nr:MULTISPECIES: 4a-hydroxytetrahydrobiopterin dehydratase [unclassified Bacillus (in: firmicutes)]PFO10202.1 4a-hydroxytetrahydrobiopterin dehydratase [Bacillus sp. AFS076308]PGV48543.1 4a-hydroxytetrahydrobiopterin dehydratase [Bacillus sp. AFS037270]
MAKRLSLTEIDQALDALPGWKLDGKFIVKKYRFREFLSGVGFVNEIAELSEEKNHHPFIAIDYKLVTLRLTSWNAGGLTDLDIELAKNYDVLYEKYKGK